MTAYLRAPIVFDPETRVARQRVTNNPRYPVQQPLAGLAEAIFA